MTQAKRTSAKTPANLPRRPETWHLTVRKLSHWVELDGGEIAQPYLSLVVNLKDDFLLDSQLHYEFPTADETRGLLWHAMLKPARELRLPPHRPTEIICDQENLVAELSPILAGIDVKISYETQIEELEDLINELEDEFGGESEFPGLLSVRENTPELIGDFYQAAAQAFREEPWIYLSSEQPVKYEIQATGKSGFVQILGNSGIEFGLLVYETWEDVERSYLSLGEAHPALPEKGLTALSYVTKELMSAEDLEAIHQYHWPIEAENAYPVPMIMFEEQVERPDPLMLLTFTTLSRALPEFAQQLEPDLQGDYHPLSSKYSVPSSRGMIEVSLEYPAGSLKMESFPAMIDLGEEEDEGDEENVSEAEQDEDTSRIHPRFDHIELKEVSFDRDIAFGTDDESLDDWLASPVAESNPNLVTAMGLIYMAWNEYDPAQRVQYARQALEISPDCAEAYSILADDLAVNIGQALKYYQKGVDVGKQALGSIFFEKHTGEFWKHIQARPYLRALAETAHVYWELGRVPEALDTSEMVLQLDPGDPLEMGTLKLLALLHMHRYDEAYTFVKGIQDLDTLMLYTRALLAFQQTGDSSEAQESLHTALQANPHVPDYLAGSKRLPPAPPPAVYPGHKSEAIEYAGIFIPYWRRIPGAIDWLRKVSRADGSPSKNQPKSSRRKKR
jgi:tetratricopeptide (TPR) repeat protein